MTLLDARTLTAAPSGIGVYTRNLLAGLHEAGPERPVRVWLRPGLAGTLGPQLRGSRALDLLELPGSPASPGHLLRGARAARRDARGGVFHVPDAFAPAVGRLDPVVTLHDVIPLVCGGQLARSKKRRLRWLWRAWLLRQTARARAVVTVSEHAAGEIHRVLGVPREKLEVIHNAVPPPPPLDPAAPDPAAPPVARQPGGRFVLNVGRRDPYKNVPGLVRAFGRMRAEHPRLRGVRLVVVGPPDPRYPEAEAAADAPGVRGSVEFRGYVGARELAGLYAAAAAVAVPSRFEGFGLPLAEAMAAGAPVVCSDRASLPEVAGGAALLVDPDDEAALAAALARVLLDAELAAGLAARGRARAASFGLRAFGERHLRLYERLERAGGGRPASA